MLYPFKIFIFYMYSNKFQQIFHIFPCNYSNMYVVNVQSNNMNSYKIIFIKMPE